MAEQVIKGLPKNEAGQLSFEPFQANGNRYVFIRPGEEISILKWKHYQQLSIVTGFGRTFAEIVQALQEIQAELGSDQPIAKSRVDAILKIDSLTRGILDMSRERYEKAFYLCTLFIYREGDDPATWDMATAERYIEDWTAENISPTDLFFFASLLIREFREKFRELSERAEKTQVELSGAIG